MTTAQPRRRRIIPTASVAAPAVRPDALPSFAAFKRLVSQVFDNEPDSVTIDEASESFQSLVITYIPMPSSRSYPIKMFIIVDLNTSLFCIIPDSSRGQSIMFGWMPVRWVPITYLRSEIRGMAEFAINNYNRIQTHIARLANAATSTNPDQMDAARAVNEAKMLKEVVIQRHAQVPELQVPQSILDQLDEIINP